MTGRFPGGARFGFTIMDDADVATVANVGPIYGLRDEIGTRTTKNVEAEFWSLPKAYACHSYGRHDHPVDGRVHHDKEGRWRAFLSRERRTQ